ncbi:MAG: TonB-dependent receptor plug domain-containing protein, partial [Polyangiaceae bacterium]|nr:TonB-dependent receptor plug domain-containing protein [Polyangiaceae bacterium]
MKRATRQGPMDRAQDRGSARFATRLAYALCLSIALVGTWLPTATADVRTEARRHFRRGMELIDRGELDAGIAELTIAYDTLPHPNVLYNIGRAYADAGRYNEALEYFERYLDTAPSDRVEVVAFVKAIGERLGSARATESEAPATTTAPAARADTEDLTALREAAIQIEALAESTNSDALRDRARVLREMAASLEATQTQGEERATQPPEVTVSGSPPAAAAPPELALVQEDLYGETVVSASRFAQDPLDAPSATYNITRQDIRLAGLPNIGEMVRRAPGVHAMATGPSDIQLGIRGFNLRVSPSVLMLVNGRSVYLDPLGTVSYWNVPFGMDEVERIEVIRGPASALYGADAFSGVINVITRRPGDEPGTYVFA